MCPPLDDRTGSRTQQSMWDPTKASAMLALPGCRQVPVTWKRVLEHSSAGFLSPDQAPGLIFTHKLFEMRAWLSSRACWSTNDTECCTPFIFFFKKLQPWPHWLQPSPVPPSSQVFRSATNSAQALGSKSSKLELTDRIKGFLNQGEEKT